MRFISLYLFQGAKSSLKNQWCDNSWPIKSFILQVARVQWIMNLRSLVSNNTRWSRIYADTVIDLQGQDVALNKYGKFARRVSFMAVFNNRIIIVSAMYILYEECIRLPGFYKSSFLVACSACPDYRVIKQLL